MIGLEGGNGDTERLSLHDALMVDVGASARDDKGYGGLGRDQAIWNG